MIRKEVKSLHGTVSQKRKKKRHLKVKSTKFLNVKKQELSRHTCNTVCSEGERKKNVESWGQ